MEEGKWKSRTKDELIIEVWEQLDCESVGTSEIEPIQQVLREAFGEGAVVSPAYIARLVADEGAVLRHPEVLECDTSWRERKIASKLPSEQLNFTTLAEASDSIRKLEALRIGFLARQEHTQVRGLQELAQKYRNNLRLVAMSRILPEKERLSALEITQWLTIWLKQPEIFEDWLSLRTSSPDFLRQLSQ